MRKSDEVESKNKKKKKNIEPPIFIEEYSYFQPFFI